MPNLRASYSSQDVDAFLKTVDFSTQSNDSDKDVNIGSDSNLRNLVVDDDDYVAPTCRLMHNGTSTYCGEGFLSDPFDSVRCQEIRDTAGNVVACNDAQTSTGRALEIAGIVGVGIVACVIFACVARQMLNH